MKKAFLLVQKLSLLLFTKDHLRQTECPVSYTHLDVYKRQVEVGVARGKQLHDKRDTIAKRDNERDLQRAIKGDW